MAKKQGRHMPLNYTTCKNCKKSYLVGLNGKDIRERKKAGGFTAKEAVVAIGNEELKTCKEIPEDVECPNCKTICVVKNSKEK